VDENSKDLKSSQNVKRDEVLKRMLKTPPKPHETLANSEIRKMRKFADSKLSKGNVSGRNAKPKRDA
jgi:hypothetical protein